MIDWEDLADINNWSQEQFRKEILTVAAVVGAMELDKSNEEGEVFRFTCSDDAGKIELYVRRTNGEKGDL